MRKISLTLLAIMATIVASASPLWLRYSQISPNGENITFSYKGDIYTVSSKGGEATQLTTTESYESNPIWSPDSKTIAFSTNRNGNFDIYVVPADGGIAKRVTTNSSTETPLSFSADGKKIYYSAYVQKPAENVQFPSGWFTELYSINVNGGRPEQIVNVPVMNMSLGTDGKSFIYENRTGSENNWRKHHVSSVARNIFLYNAADKSHKQLTTNVGEDRNPIYTADGKVIFLSERDGGSFNVYIAEQNNLDNAKEITNFKNHPVRFLSQADNGMISYGYHGEIYTQELDGKPVKVNIEIKNDVENNQVQTMNFTSGQEYAITPDGSQIVFTNRGEVFATTDKFPTTKQITNTVATERGITISPDGRTIAYASERNDIWNIYTAKMNRENEINFANSTLIDEKPLFENPKVERFAPQYSPDGKEIAFIEDRRFLKVINLETKKVRQITDGSKHYSTDDWGFNFQWSPDGKWFAMEVITNTRNPYSDIAIVSASGDGLYHNISNSSYIDNYPTWVLDGNAIIYSSNRYGMRSQASWGSQNDVFIAFLNQDAFDKFRMSKEEYALMKEEKKQEEKAAAKKDDKKKDKKDEDSKEEKEEKNIVVDLDGLKDRVMILTPMSTNLGGYMLSKDGSKLYFLAAFEDNYDLWVTSLRSRSTRIIKKNSGYGDLKLSKDGKTLYLLGRNPQKINLSSNSSTPIRFKTSIDFNLTDERAFMYDHMFTQQNKRFFRTDYNGADLPQLKKDYQAFLPHITNNFDYAEMLSEILGEVNVSHTGSGYRPKAKMGAESTAELGLIFDQTYTGNGLKISEILAKGPFDKKVSKVQKGDIITKINGVTIESGKDYFTLLNKQYGKNVLVSLTNPTTKENWEETIKPTSKGAINEILYKRWIKTRKAETERLSGGRIGYVHIRSMDDSSYRKVYADALGQYNNYDGVVIDTRYNGGGRLHEDIEQLFDGEKYLEQVIRGRETGDMPSRRYNKHSIMITNEANYSNAHGTPWVYRYRKMGSLVGMPVPGTMSTVSWETLQDPSLYFGTPIVGYRTKDGIYLENTQLEPDFKVVNTPEKVNAGSDEQLEKAVAELLKQIDANPTW